MSMSCVPVSFESLFTRDWNIVMLESSIPRINKKQSTIQFYSKVYGFYNKNKYKQVIYGEYYAVDLFNGSNTDDKCLDL